MTGAAEWQRAIEEAEAGDCASLLKLVPDVRAVIERDGEIHPFRAALAECPLLIWRVAIAFAHRGDPGLLAFLSVDRIVPSEVRADVRRAIEYPVTRRRQGPPTKIDAATRAQAMRAVVTILNLAPTTQKGQLRALRGRLVRKIAADAQVDERTIRTEIAKHFRK